MKILFICKHNRFRSKVAEAVFSKLDKRDEIKSAGIAIDLLRPYVAENVKKELARRGYQLKSEQSREINEQDLKWADLIVIVADNIDEKIFDKKTRAKIEIWKIPDANEQELEKIREIIGEIEKKVRKLVESLNE